MGQAMKEIGNLICLMDKANLFSLTDQVMTASGANARDTESEPREQRKMSRFKELGRKINLTDL